METPKKAIAQRLHRSEVIRAPEPAILFDFSMRKTEPHENETPFTCGIGGTVVPPLFNRLNIYVGSSFETIHNHSYVPQWSQ